MTPNRPFRTLLSSFTAHLRRALSQDRDAGASALEWAVIAAVVVVAASLIGGVVYNVVQTKSEALKECSTVAVGAACGSGL